MHHFFKDYNHESKQFKNRIAKSILLLLFFIICLIMRLIYLQIFNYTFFHILSSKNRLEYLPIEAKRGLIFDRNGILLAENIPIFNLNIISTRIKTLSDTVKELTNIVDITNDDIRKLQRELRQKHHFEYITLKSQLTNEMIASFYVNQYKLPGIIIDSTMIRYYPLKEITAHIIGYVGKMTSKDIGYIENDFHTYKQLIGKLGIEKFYENILCGKQGYKIVEVDVNGKIVSIIKTVLPISGSSIYLTIDSKLQKIIQDNLKGEKGAAIAINPNNGEILTLVSSPSYDPNIFTIRNDKFDINKLQLLEGQPMYNRATKGIFPFGSTIKPFIAIQALDTKVITTDFKIYDPGWFKLNNKNVLYHDWQSNGHGWVDITKAITESCNTFFYTISIKLGIEKMNYILKQFGFGRKTGIDLPEESSGIVTSPVWKMNHRQLPWYLGDTIISGIGQGDMKTTVIQLAQGTAAISLHGKRFLPHLLLAVQSTEGKKIFKRKIELTPIVLHNNNNWNIVINAMKKVTMHSTGTAYNDFGINPKYEIAGKTGTAQLYHNSNDKLKDEKRLPKHLRNHHLFISFAPINNPKIVTAIVVENKNMAQRIAKLIFDYYLTQDKTT